MDYITELMMMLDSTIEANNTVAENTMKANAAALEVVLAIMADQDKANYEPTVQDVIEGVDVDTENYIPNTTGEEEFDPYSVLDDVEEEVDEIMGSDPNELMAKAWELAAWGASNAKVSYLKHKYARTPLSEGI